MFILIKYLEIQILDQFSIDEGLFSLDLVYDIMI